MNDSTIVQKTLHIEERLESLGLELDFTDNAFLVKRRTNEGTKILSHVTSIDGLSGFIDGWTAFEAYGS